MYARVVRLPNTPMYTGRLDYSVSGCTVPGLHSVATDEPVEQDEPAGQTMQSSALVIDMLSSASVAFWDRPAGHGSPTDAPLLQYLPSSQGTHSVFRSRSWNVPAGQSSQTDRPATAAKVPGLHDLQSASFELPGIGFAVPAGH